MAAATNADASKAARLVISRIHTRFDEEKTTAAASVLLHEAGGEMKYFVLLKLLYLADRESWLKYNRPITGDDYVSMDHGPVLSTTYNLILDDSEGPWADAIERFVRYVKLRGEPDYTALSEAEIKILKEAYHLYKMISQWKLRDFTHTLPEWTDPKGSSIPITPEDILRALEKGPEEIDEARQEALERAEFQEIFGT
ncbi:MAG: Panacea domain-containing protein [Acidobacteriota bacterium]|nr:MAG: Panacea domain-containing protein [Acidobacteriota bacterium]